MTSKPLVQRLQEATKITCGWSGEDVIDPLLYEAADWIDRASAVLPLIQREVSSDLALEISHLLAQQTPQPKPVETTDTRWGSASEHSKWQLDHNFAEVAFGFTRAQCSFEEQLDEAGLADKYKRIGWDYYDESLELYEVADDVRLSEAQQRIIFNAGFSRVFVNHKDKWETHYTWGKQFAPRRGWRRRYVSDPTATTSNVIAGKPNPGYYEISYWPEGWKDTQWLETGYMRIVPDPLTPETGSPAAEEAEE